MQQHESQVAGLEKERDFYYQKLRDIEMICQEPEFEANPYIQKILDILYATEVRMSSSLLDVRHVRRSSSLNALLFSRKAS